MNRRAFLLGSAAAVVASKLPANPTLEVYGVGPAMRALEEMRFIEGIRQQIAHTIIYGNTEYSPTQFTGLAARYSA